MCLSVENMVILVYGLYDYPCLWFIMFSLLVDYKAMPVYGEQGYPYL